MAFLAGAGIGSFGRNQVALANRSVPETDKGVMPFAEPHLQAVDN
jgi:hypothetical protein